MPVICTQCGGDDLERDQGSQSSETITVRCLSCGARFTREPELICNRCGSKDVATREYEGWAAYDDIEQAREDPDRAAWSSYDREEFRCMVCGYSWRKSGSPRPFQG
jgi:hypothetical protein